LTYPENLGTGRPHKTQTIREKYLIGLCLLRLDRQKEAAEHFKEAAAETAGMPSEEAYYRGKALEALGQKKEATSIFKTMKSRCEAALEKQKTASLYHWAALACHGLGDVENADVYLKLAIRVNPSFRNAIIFGRN